MTSNIGRMSYVKHLQLCISYYITLYKSFIYYYLIPTCIVVLLWWRSPVVRMPVFSQQTFLTCSQFKVLTGEHFVDKLSTWPTQPSIPPGLVNDAVHLPMFVHFHTFWISLVEAINGCRVYVFGHGLWPSLNAGPSVKHSAAAAARMWLVVLHKCSPLPS